MDMINKLETVTLREARLLLPHRSNSVIQDWIDKGIAEAEISEGGRGIGRPYRFPPWQLLDLLVVDQFSALGIFAQKYKGRNFGGAGGEGNVEEFFDYPDKKVTSAKRRPARRSRKHAINFYKQFDAKVLISIDLVRVPAPVKVERGAVKLTTKERHRAKIGMLYYRINYFPEDPQFDPDATENEDPHPSLREEVMMWRNGHNALKGPTLCLISVDLLRKHIESVLKVRF